MSSDSLTHKERMLAGLPYYAYDPELVTERLAARRLTRLFNATAETESERRIALLRELFGSLGDSRALIEPPFHCDYGYNIHVGKRFFANFDCVVLDICEVRIGDDCLLGPGVHIYGAVHPLDAATRSSGEESGKPVRIGNQVWVGGRAVIMPGVTIGNNVVIAAGSLVLRDMPDNVLVAGNPAVIKKDLT